MEKSVEKPVEIDKIEKPPENQEVIESIAAPAPTPTEQEKGKEKKRTWGNIIYDFPVFGGVAWGGVALLSAISSHEANFGQNKYFNWLRSLNTTVFNALESGLGKTILKNAKHETVKGYAKGTTMFLTLGMGGNALMWPIKLTEDNRQKNAAKIDKFLGTTPPDPELIAGEPKQTWSSVLKGRLTSWGLSYLAFLGMGPALTQELNVSLGEKATNAWMKWRPQSNPINVRKWADIAAFDALFTVITAATTYIFSRYFAKKEDRKIDAADELFEINTVDPKAFTREFSKTKNSEVELQASAMNEDKKEQKTFADKFSSKRGNVSSIATAPMPFIERVNPSDHSGYAIT